MWDKIGCHRGWARLLVQIDQIALCRFAAWPRSVDVFLLQIHKYHVETLTKYKLGFNQNHNTFDSILLVKIIMCSKIHSNKFINYRLFNMKSGSVALDGHPTPDERNVADSKPAVGRLGDPRFADGKHIFWRSVSGQTTYRGTSLTRKRTPLGLYRRPMPKVLGGS